MQSKPIQPLKAIVGLLVFAFALLLSPAVSAQGQDFGRLGIEPPEATDKGEWPGTYFYVSARKKMAAWIRVSDGKPQIKLRVAEGPRGDNFTVDWNGIAEYQRGEIKGRFELKFDEANANRIVGSWEWTKTLGDSKQVETASFEIYRAGVGRQMIWDIRDVKREFIGKFRGPPALDHVVWSFQKASRRMAGWPELPF